MRFPIVATTEGLILEKFKDPEAALDRKILGQVVINDNDLAAKIMEESKAGRAVYLQAKTVDRLDGTFIVAAVVTTLPASGQVEAKQAVPTTPAIQPSGSGSGSGSGQVDPFQGSGSGEGIGSGSGEGSGSGPAV